MSFSLPGGRLSSRPLCGFIALLAAFAMWPVHAEVSRVEISQRVELFKGRAYGDAGAYEWLQGHAYFTLDPANARNKAVVDLELAPKNKDGLVEFSADISILRPKDPAKANGVAVFDVVNRGRETILEYLNRGSRTAKVLSEAFIGNGALYVALDQWVRMGTAPPPSRYPRLADRNLVARPDLNVKGYATLSVPATPIVPVRMDSGERTPGVPTVIPPKLGKPYAVFVPQVDADGNDLGGVRVPELAVPLATYTGWNLRHPETGAPGDLVQLGGSYRPFARTRAEREQSGDTRLSIAERYASREAFLEAVRKESDALVTQRLLMPEDVVHVLKRADDHWTLLHAEAAIARP